MDLNKNAASQLLYKAALVLMIDGVCQWHASSCGVYCWKHHGWLHSGCRPLGIQLLAFGSAVGACRLNSVCGVHCLLLHSDNTHDFLFADGLIWYCKHLCAVHLISCDTHQRATARDAVQFL
jgi:hypothetical protein